MKINILILLLAAFGMQILSAADIPFNAALKRKVESIILPDVNISNYSIRAALDLVKNLGVSSDTEPDPSKKGVSLVIKAGRGDIDAIRITCQMKAPTLEETLFEIGRQANLKIIYAPYAVVFVPVNEGE